MHVVALDPTDRGATAAAALAEVLRLTRLEARARVQAAEDSACVVARFAQRAAAEECAARLRAAGLPCRVLAPADLPRPLAVTRFELGDDGLTVLRGDPAAAGRQVPWTSVRRLLRATELDPGTDTEVVRERKLSLGRAILTGGLVMTRVEKRTRKTTRGERLHALFLDTDQGSTLRFAAHGLDYRGLGTRLSPQAADNFDRLSEALRERAPGATFDDRLMDRTFQAAVLGPGLDPERHLDLALALVRIRA